MMSMAAPPSSGISWARMTVLRRSGSASHCTAPPTPWEAPTCRNRVSTASFQGRRTLEPNPPLLLHVLLIEPSLVRLAVDRGADLALEVDLLAQFLMGADEAG